MEIQLITDDSLRLLKSSVTMDIREKFCLRKWVESLFAIFTSSEFRLFFLLSMKFLKYCMIFRPKGKIEFTEVSADQTLKTEGQVHGKPVFFKLNYTKIAFFSTKQSV